MGSSPSCLAVLRPALFIDEDCGTTDLHGECQRFGFARIKIPKKLLDFRTIAWRLDGHEAKIPDIDTGQPCRWRLQFVIHNRRHQHFCEQLRESLRWAQRSNRRRVAGDDGHDQAPI